ncbi:hypothetical protein NMY22_g694 [Coprinellus aureogranulatus]|nr:hypothetical protein NMY22_g694 [Coprinellus aureogranulatus]
MCESSISKRTRWTILEFLVDYATGIPANLFPRRNPFDMESGSSGAASSDRGDQPSRAWPAILDVPQDLLYQIASQLKPLEILTLLSVSVGPVHLRVRSQLTYRRLLDLHRTPRSHQGENNWVKKHENTHRHKRNVEAWVAKGGDKVNREDEVLQWKCVYWRVPCEKKGHAIVDKVVPFDEGEAAEALIMLKAGVPKDGGKRAVVDKSSEKDMLEFVRRDSASTKDD